MHAPITLRHIRTVRVLDEIVVARMSQFVDSSLHAFAQFGNNTRRRCVDGLLIVAGDGRVASILYQRLCHVYVMLNNANGNNCVQPQRYPNNFLDFRKQKLTIHIRYHLFINLQVYILQRTCNISIIYGHNHRVEQ